MDKRTLSKFDRSRYEHLDWQKTDTHLATILNVSRQRIGQIRERMGITTRGPKPTRGVAQRTARMLAWLTANRGKLLGLSIAEWCDLSPEPVSHVTMRRLRRLAGLQRRRLKPVTLENLPQLVTVKAATGCWEWNFSRHPSGYSRIGRCYGHVYVYALCHGPQPKSVVIRHRCDNPCCVRPDHLVAGTVADNMHDRGSRGRTANGHKLNWGKVREIRALYRGTRDMIPLSEKFGVCPGTIYQIAKGRSWREGKPA